MRTRIAIILVAALAALTVTAVPSASAATNVHEAVLKGSAAFPQVNGKAKFQVDNGVRELQVEIEDANALIGQKLRIRVNSVLVGTMTVNSFGNARFDKRSNTLPAVTTGTPIRIRRAADGTLVASGRFA
jgi:hypothetical protein